MREGKGWEDNSWRMCSFSLTKAWSTCGGAFVDVKCECVVEHPMAGVNTLYFGSACKGERVQVVEWVSGMISK